MTFAAPPSTKLAMSLFLWGMAASLACAATQIPTNPTTIVYDNTNASSHVYIFRAAPGSTSQFELGSIDISSTIDSSPPYTTLYPTLPFLDAKAPRPFTAASTSGDGILVYTGNCSDGANGASLWRFTPKASTKDGNGTWDNQQISYDHNSKYVSSIGPNYLSGGVAFSPNIDSNGSSSAGAYFFGGMCPWEAANSSNWQASATYSNSVLTLEPSRQSDASINFNLELSAARGPPIPEAGFSLTGLPPSYTNRSDGTQTQQRNYVLLGGHTNTAFINTSQIALFSLPQESWTFIPIEQPLATSARLFKRAESAAIEPRSGHSAVLSPDGQRIVIFGGWIGDVDTPAEPQLAILRFGDGYGGTGDWTWETPMTTGSSLIPSGSGVFGHGAVMLPGGIMMIIGGQEIPSTNSQTRRRASNSGPRASYFNISSNAWITSYTPPPHADLPPDTPNGALSSPAQKAGLGVGLAIGIAVVLSLLCFYLWYTRRLKQQRRSREQQLRDLATDAHQYNIDRPAPIMDGQGGCSEMVQHTSDSYFQPLGTPQQTQGWRRASSNEAERTGLLVEIPSPTRGLRRSMSGRTSHQTPRHDEHRNRGSGHIAPIDELDEDQHEEHATDATPLNTQTEAIEHARDPNPSVFDNAPLLDPFTDSSAGMGRQKTIVYPGERSNEATSMDNSLLVAPRHTRRLSPGCDGRQSPTKSSERTGSNLSERSILTSLSSHSTDAGVHRNASVRSTAILNSANSANPFKTPDGSPTSETAIHSGSGWQTPVDIRTRSLTSIRSNGRPGTANADRESFATARSSFMNLQAEGEALLGGNPERMRPDTSSISSDSNGHSLRDTATASRTGTMTTNTSITEVFSRAANTRERRKSWLGSVRRVISRSGASSDRTKSLTAAATVGIYKDDPEASEQDDHVKRRSLPSPGPRRAASDASFWRSRRGKQDWLEDDVDSNDPHAKWRRNSGDDWGAPEDIARAEKESQRRAWRERGNLLINLTDGRNDSMAVPTPRTPIHSHHLGVPITKDDNTRPRTPADEDDWDVEAAVERRVVQVMFTVPKSKLRVVNADVDGSSVLSFQKDSHEESSVKLETPQTISAIQVQPQGQVQPQPQGSPGRVKDLAGRFEQMTAEGGSSSPRMAPRESPRPSASPSITPMKIRRKAVASAGAGKE